MNFLDRISQFKPIESAQIPELHDAFEIAIINPAEIVKIFGILHNNFIRIDFDPQFIVENYTTYWRWYVESAWGNTLNLKEGEFLVAFPKQFVTAIIFDYPVEDRLLDFMYYKIGETGEVQKFYKEIRTQIFQEQMPVSTIDYTIARLVEDIRSLSRKTDIEQASFFSRIEKEIFAPGRTFFEFSSTEKGERIGDIVYFINFLLKTEDISEIYEEYLVSYLDDHDSDIVKEEKMATGVESSPESTIVVDRKPSYYTIFEEVKNSSASASEDRDEQIILRLDELARQYHDEQIKDLYFFDETKGEFVWNEELLNQE